MVGVNSNWLGVETGKNRGSRNSVGFTMETANGAVAWERSCECIVVGENGKGGGGVKGVSSGESGGIRGKCVRWGAMGKGS